LKDEEVNLIVPWSLGEIGDKSAIPPLIETLGDSSLEMRAASLRALEKLGAKWSKVGLTPVAHQR
jgi:HEAT repeat protein